MKSSRGSLKKTKFSRGSLLVDLATGKTKIREEDVNGEASTSNYRHLEHGYEKEEATVENIDSNHHSEDDSSELDEEQTRMADELNNLFGSDLSDDDPTFRPYEQPASLSSSENEALLSLADLQSQMRNEEVSHNRVDQIDFDNAYQESSSLPLSNVETLQVLTGQDTINEKLDNRVESNIMVSDVRCILDEVLQKVWRSVRPKKRWRGAEPENWAISIAKRRRAEGLCYTLKKKTLAPKVPKIIQCGTCKYQCTEKFNSEDRERLCRHYWKLDFKSKKNFLLSCVSIQAPKRVLTNRLPNRKPRSYAKNCFLRKGENSIQVCQKFFCFTLCISPDVIRRAIEKKNEFGIYEENDHRGEKEPPNKTKPVILNHVKSHIESFPNMEAHYVRKDSRRKYLDQQLSITKMYKLYLEKCKEDGITEPVSELTYRRTFGKNYNLSFFIPKKDQCLVCSNYDKASPSSKQELQQHYDQHIERKTKCNNEKLKDKQRANDETNYMSLTFDLQAILQIPSGNVGLLYYMRKMCVFNLTLYEAPLPNAGYCFTWSEVNGKKGSSEVGSILYHYLKNCLPNNITEISLYSDTCGGQNRNQYVSALLLWAVQRIENLHVIEQKFLESGHSHMEADSMHSSIESAKRHTSIYGMPDWISIFKRARSQKTRMIGRNKVIIEPYQVKEFKFNEFFDLKALADKTIINRTRDHEGKKVQWLKIKRLRYVKGEPDKIFFNYDMSENLSHIKVSTRYAPNLPRSHSTRIKSRSAQNSPAPTPQTPDSDIHLKPLYNTPLPISIAKKNDLIRLCTKGVIPEEFHAWFKALATSSTVVDRVPEPAVEESSDEEF